MKKNTRILILSATALAVLGGVTAVLLLTAPVKEPETSGGEDTGASVSAAEEAADMTLCSRTESEVSSLEVSNDIGKFSITPSGKTDADGEPEWTIADIASAPLDTSALSTAVGNIVSLEAKEFAEEVSDSAELAKYGLDAPKTTVTAKFTDGTEFTVKVGIDVPNSLTAAYVTADGKNVYTINKSKVTSFCGSELGFVKLQAMPDYDQSSGEEVRKMTVERFDLEVPLVLETVEPDNDDGIQVYSFRMVSPYTAYADLTDSPNFMYSIFGQQASGCEKVSAGEKDMESCGLTAPLCVVTTETNRGTYTLTLGNPIYETVTNEDGTESSKIAGFYGISSEVPDVVYRFDAATIAALQVYPEQLISKMFLMPYIYSLSSIDYSDAEGRKLSIGVETIKAQSEDEQDVHNFYLDGQPTAEQPVKDLYQYLISASAEELYFEDDKGEFLAEITYNYKDPASGIGGKDTVRFYNSATDRKVVIELNGSSLCKARRMYITQLYSNIDNFLTGKDIVLTY